MRDTQKLPVLFLQLFSVSLKSYQNKVTKNHIQYNWSAYLSRPYTAGLRGKHTKRQCLSKVRCILFFFQKKKYKSWYKKHPFRVRFIFFFHLLSSSLSYAKIPLPQVSANILLNSSWTCLWPSFGPHHTLFWIVLLFIYVSHLFNCIVSPTRTGTTYTRQYFYPLSILNMCCNA